MSTSPTLDYATLLGDKDALRLIIRGQLSPPDGSDRFQPAGFPEVGHVLYDAPRKDGTIEKVCIVDSAASMANHLEAVCVWGPHDLEPVAELSGLPYVRCVTDSANGKKDRVVVTSLTEGHRLASTYFLGQKQTGGRETERTAARRRGKAAKEAAGQKATGGVGFRLMNGELAADSTTFGEELRSECGILDLGTRSMALPEDWWTVFKRIFRYDPNSLVHGVLFPQWNVKIPRVLTAHLEALGAARVGSAGIKFDRLQKTVSGQPIFAIDEESAREISATFILDLALVRSFGRDGKGLHENQKAFLLAFALWKVGRLLSGPFRYRTACDLVCESASVEIVRARQSSPVAADADRALAASAPTPSKVDWLNELQKMNMKDATAAAKFEEPLVTDIYWPYDKLFKEEQGAVSDLQPSRDDETEPQPDVEDDEHE